MASCTAPQETTKNASQRVTPSLRSNRLLGSWLHPQTETCQRKISGQKFGGMYAQEDIRNEEYARNNAVARPNT